jgi:hypothetical protein
MGTSPDEGNTEGKLLGKAPGGGEKMVTIAEEEKGFLSQRSSEKPGA